MSIWDADAVSGAIDARRPRHKRPPPSPLPRKGRLNSDLCLLLVVYPPSRIVAHITHTLLTFFASAGLYRSILAATASSAAAITSSSPAASDVSTQTTSADVAPLAQSTTSDSSQATPTPSQKLAQAVLAGQGAASVSTSQNTDIAKLQAALGGGLGGPTSPIVVTLAERE